MSKKNEFYSRKARKKGNKGSNLKVVRTINGVEIHDKIVNTMNLNIKWAKKHLIVLE